MHFSNPFAAPHVQGLCYVDATSDTEVGAPVSNVEWLLRESMDERTLRIGKHNVLDDGRWRATIERIEIGAGLRVFLTSAEIHHDITIEAHDDRTDRWLGSQVTVDGGADIDFLDGEKINVTAERALLFRPSGRRAAYSLMAGSTFRSAGYGLEVERIRRLFDDAVPHVLLGLLESQVEPSRIVAMKASRLMRRLASSLFDDRLNGPLRALMMEGVVIQLLALQTAAAADQCLGQPQRPLSERERRAICEARERLLADMHRPPSLGDLATAVGLTEKRLNAGFRSLYGRTVFETLKNERLEHARIAFESGDIALKEVAFRVGYNHLSNFINAFTSRYGAPPRQYFEQKRQRRTAPQG
jgi:AraC-like DNA-binding protein